MTMNTYMVAIWTQWTSYEQAPYHYEEEAATPEEAEGKAIEEAYRDHPSRNVYSAKAELVPSGDA